LYLARRKQLAAWRNARSRWYSTAMNEMAWIAALSVCALLAMGTIVLVL
jgi:hypothetical protein